ncbi:Translation machinery-associated protein 22 [Malassezia vespertilionis]|uniref:Translation machinery-associated protein 22 n=1 Tax=Malassezia vespertilionis TaxID=2020962 RepID=UPI0024B1B47D|nr:Translation machinery-associated protein 22 [Malassezia vespertilionis]WFD05754.1 Translation machinery-associated protein 22 [Malassezia vespertilionis]
MSAVAAQPEAEAPPERFPPRSVHYCEICTFPYEYCEYGSSLTKCKANLESRDPVLFSSLYSEEAITDKLKSLTTEQAESLERESAKRERKAEAKAEKERAQLASSKVILSRVARTKRKVITCITGLHLFSPPLPALKVIAKGLSSRFATGASVSQSIQNPGVDEIHIQGDVLDEVKKMLLQRAKPFEKMPSVEDGGLLEKNIVIDEKAK